MFTCPKCGSTDIHRTDNVQGGCGTIMLGFFMLLFLGVLGGPPKWIAWLFLFALAVGTISIVSGLTGDRYILHCRECENRWRTS